MAPFVPAVCREAEEALPSPQAGRVSEGDARGLAHVLAGLTSPVPGDESQSQRFSSFVAVCPPQIDIFDYLARLLAHFKCSRECYVVALVYIERATRLNPDFTLNSLTIHRLLLTSLVLAVKFTDDMLCPNSWYAQVGGVSNRELNALEAELLQLVGWRLQVSPEEYESCHARLRSQASPPPGAGGGAKRSPVEAAEDDLASTRADSEADSEDAIGSVVSGESAVGAPAAVGAATPAPPPRPPASPKAVVTSALKKRACASADADLSSSLALFMLGPCLAWACRPRTRR